MTKAEDYRHILKEQLAIRQELNPNYSLRSFARDLGVPSSNLSEVLNNQRGFSKVTAYKVTAALKFSKSETERFIDLVMASDARSKREKQSAIERLRRGLTPKKEIQELYFRAISDWYYLALLELVHIKDFQSNHHWIAQKLGITLSQADLALNRMVKLGTLKKVKEKYFSTQTEFVAESPIPSMSIKKFHHQMLNKALKALREQSIHKRSFSSLTIAINEDDIPFVKEEMTKFRRELNQKLTERNKEKKPTTVYALTTQFFELLTQKEEKE